MLKKDSLSMQAFRQNSYLFGGNAAYLEELYETYLADPTDVPLEWKKYFDALPVVNGHAGADVSHEAIQQHFIQLARENKGFTAGPQGESQKQSHVLQLINAYRSHGHSLANLDPLKLQKVKPIDDLALAHHHLSEVDFDAVFYTNSYKGLGKNQGTLKEIYQSLKDIYCGSIGLEYRYIQDVEQVTWIQDRIEMVKGKPALAKADKINILKQLTAAEGLEVYLGKKYVGQKRFSLEGSDSLIPLLMNILRNAAKQEVKELIIGMAHRGRLNVLINVLGKAPAELFQEFEGIYYDEDRSGDVKYHMGFSSDIRTDAGTIHLALGFNPSHLEIISPVIEGTVRTRQERRHDINRNQVVPIVIHGDAAFAGQGVVMETFNMSQARGYTVGGTVHIVINNQIGFTTSDPHDARSTIYCTDVAKMIQAPIIHVNGDDPEAVVFAAELAFDFRMKFKKDVIIDLISYRRHGHNESDEPSITQPVMYQTIKSHATPLALYNEKLLKEGIIDKNTADEFMQHYRDKLDKAEIVAHVDPDAPISPVDWKKYHHPIDPNKSVNTGVDKHTLLALGKKLLTLPKDFKVQPQVARELEHRAKMLSGEMPFFWGMAETLAYASLLNEGYPVRISGQDSGRGTFSHRHAVLHDFETGNEYIPLAHIAKDEAPFIVIDSVLSEEAVLAFEYGYSISDPERLVIWEAQFGDFFNGAQVVVDQFISSGEQKWGRLSGLILLLPHGYEGMGPEHSSARPERFLQLCAQQNMQVCVPSTPAQCFHMLRRQLLSNYRKPLIVMTPKSLLRNKAATSTLDELSEGSFKELIPEINQHDFKKITRMILCSGKVYYDLMAEREAEKRDTMVIVRVEQLYPFPKELLKNEIARYPHLKEIIWCQEEPQNQGAWYSSQHNIRECMTPAMTLAYAGRAASAAPAVGYSKLHAKQQKALIEEALKIS